MNEYFFPGILFTFLVLYLFFENVRIGKLKKTLLPEIRYGYVQNCQASFYSSLLLITAAFCLSLCYTFFPQLYGRLYPISMLNRDLINATGILVIKISFIALLIAGLMISKETDETTSVIPLKKIYRSGMLMQFLVALLLCGVFVFISNIATLVQFTASVFLFFRGRKRLRV